MQQDTAREGAGDPLQTFGARGYSGSAPLERSDRDVRMATSGGGTARALRTQVANGTLGIKTPQTRDTDPQFAQSEAPAFVAARVSAWPAVDDRGRRQLMRTSELMPRRAPT